MELKKQLYLSGGILLAISMLLYCSAFGFFGKAGFLSMAFIIGLLLFVGHQIAGWWILFQFAITRRRMGNKLHSLNRLGFGLTLAFSLLYLILIPFISMELVNTMNPYTSTLVLLIMFAFVAFQENNTNNFMQINLHKKTNQTKKGLNQSIGFLIGWITTNVLWLSIALHLQLSVFTFMYILLILIQNSLSYTTYGQSKYWNFTFESIIVVHVLALALYAENVLLLVAGMLVGLLFIQKQWYDLSYRKVTKVVGGIIYILGVSMLLLNPLKWSYSDYGLTQTIPFPLCVILIAFLVSYLMETPKFYEKIFVK